MATTIEYLSKTGLSRYDEKIKAFIAAADKADKDELQALITAANEAITAEETARKAADLTLTTEVQEAADAASAAQKTADDITTYVGTFTASEGVDTVVKYIDAKTANIASDETVGAIADRVSEIEKDYLVEADKTELVGLVSTEAAAREEADEELSGRIKTIEDDYLKAADKTALQEQITDNAEAIETLNGDSSVEGSVDKKVADAINTFATQITDDGTINTYKEVLNYIATHGGEASEMMAAIDALEELVGSKSVAVQIAEAITAENLSQYATDEELAAAIARIVVVEGKAHEHANKALLDTYTQTEADLADAVAKKHAHANASVLDGITAENVTAWTNAETNAKSYADGLNETLAEKVTALEEKVGDADVEADIEAAKTAANAYTDAEIDKVEEVVATKADASTVTELSGKVTTAEGEIDTLQTEMDAVEAKAAANETAIGTKAAQADLEAAVTRIEGLEAVQHQEIAESYIDSLFAEATA